jgi:hypothetical protein
MLVPMDNERFFVVSGLQNLAKQASGGLPGGSYEGVTPWSKEEIHSQKDTRALDTVLSGFAGFSAFDYVLARCYSRRSLMARSGQS